jgi:hypothetical protein
MRFIFLFIILISFAWGWLIISNDNADQRQPAAAFLDNQYLVAWADARSYQTYQATVIYGSRVSYSGTVLNPHGLLINAGNPDRLLPRVCAGSYEWLVIWQEGC